MVAAASAISLDGVIYSSTEKLLNAVKSVRQQKYKNIRDACEFSLSSVNEITAYKQGEGGGSVEHSQTNNNAQNIHNINGNDNNTDNYNNNDSNNNDNNNDNNNNSLHNNIQINSKAQNSPPPYDPEIFLNPFHLCCQSGNAKLAQIAIDGIQKLLAFGFFERLSVDKTFGLVCGCVEGGEDLVLIQVMRCILTGVTGSQCRVHGGVLVLCVRTLIKIFADARETQSQRTAQAALIQIVNVVIQRIELHATLHPIDIFVKNYILQIVDHIERQHSTLNNYQQKATQNFGKNIHSQNNDFQNNDSENNDSANNESESINSENNDSENTISQKNYSQKNNSQKNIPQNNKKIPPMAPLTALSAAPHIPTQNEHNQTAAKYGFCIFCRRPAPHYCVHTLDPVCSRKCKLANLQLISATNPAGGPPKLSEASQLSANNFGEKANLPKNLTNIENCEEKKNAKNSANPKQFGKKENIPNDQNSENKENIPNDQNSENKENIQNEQNSENRENIQNDENSENRETIPNDQNSENKENIPNDQNSENKENFPNEQNSENKGNFQNEQNSENKENFQNEQNSKNHENSENNSQIIIHQANGEMEPKEHRVNDEKQIQGKTEQEKNSIKGGDVKGEMSKSKAENEGQLKCEDLNCEKEMSPLGEGANFSNGNSDHLSGENMGGANLGGESMRGIKLSDYLRGMNMKEDLCKMNFGEGNVMSMEQRDALTLFQSICKLSLKEISMGSDPNNKVTRSKKLALELLLSMLQSSGVTFREDEKCMYTIKSLLCVSLIKNSVSHLPRIFNLSLSIFLFLVQNFKTSLRTEIGIFIDQILLRLLHSPNASFEHKHKVLFVIYKLAQEPSIFPEIFINFDCQIYERDLFSRIIHTLAALIQGKVTGGDHSQMIGPSQQFALRKAALEALVTFISSLSEWLRQIPPTQVIECGKGLCERMKLKRTLSLGVRKFNVKPADSVRFLVSRGCLEEDAESVATFVHRQTGLSKRKIGEFLGEGDKMHREILNNFTDMISFRKMELDVALKTFLHFFRLPGEAQKIDRMVEKFAEKFQTDNPDQFKCADCPYILAFSLIMLHTDAHSKEIKTEQKMSKAEFVKNNRGINQGQDLQQEYLEFLYDRIVEEEWELYDEDEPQKDESDESALASAFSISNAGRKKFELFLKETKGMVTRSTELMKRKEKPSREYISATPDKGEYVLYMFEVASWPLLSTFSVLLESEEEPQMIEVCLSGCRQCIEIATRFSLGVQQIAFLSSLSDYTCLKMVKEIKPKNIDCIKMLLSVGSSEGDNLCEGWALVFDCVSDLERLQLMRNSPSGSLPVQGCIRICLNYSPPNCFAEEDLTHSIVPGGLYNVESDTFSPLSFYVEDRRFNWGESSSDFKRSINMVSNGQKNPQKIDQKYQNLQKKIQKHSKNDKNSQLQTKWEIDSDVIWGEDLGDPWANLRGNNNLGNNNLGKNNLGNNNLGNNNLSSNILGNNNLGNYNLGNNNLSSHILGTNNLGNNNLSNYNLGGHMSGGVISGLELRNGEVILGEIDWSRIERFYSASWKLSVDGILYFIESLCRISTNELSCFRHPRTYLLQKLVEVADFNLTTRSLPVWHRLWPIIRRHISHAGLHPNTEVCLYAVDSLRQLVMKFLDAEDLGRGMFQIDFLAPFLVILANSFTDENLKEYIVFIILNVILNKGQKLMKGWLVISSVILTSVTDFTHSLHTFNHPNTEGTTHFQTDYIPNRHRPDPLSKSPPKSHKMDSREKRKAENDKLSPDKKNQDPKNTKKNQKKNDKNEKHDINDKNEKNENEKNENQKNENQKNENEKNENQKNENQKNENEKNEKIEMENIKNQIDNIRCTERLKTTYKVLEHILDTYFRKLVLEWAEMEFFSDMIKTLSVFSLLPFGFASHSIHRLANIALSSTRLDGVRKDSCAEEIWENEENYEQNCEKNEESYEKNDQTYQTNDQNYQTNDQNYQTNDQNYLKNQSNYQKNEKNDGRNDGKNDAKNYEKNEKSDGKKNEKNQKNYENEIKNEKNGRIDEKHHVNSKKRQGKFQQIWIPILASLAGICTSGYGGPRSLALDEFFLLLSTYAMATKGEINISDNFGGEEFGDKGGSTAFSKSEKPTQMPYKNHPGERPHCPYVDLGEFLGGESVREGWVMIFAGVVFPLCEDLFSLYYQYLNGRGDFAPGLDLACGGQLGSDEKIRKNDEKNPKNDEQIPQNDETNSKNDEQNSKNDETNSTNDETNSKNDESDEMSAKMGSIWGGRTQKYDNIHTQYKWARNAGPNTKRADQTIERICWAALKKLLLLIDHHLDDLIFMLPDFLALFISCIDGQPEAIGRLGVECLRSLLHRIGARCGARHWNSICSALTNLFKRTTPLALLPGYFCEPAEYFEMEVWPQARFAVGNEFFENPILPDTLAFETHTVVTKCIVQLLLTDLLQGIVPLHANAIPLESIHLFLKCVFDSFFFAHTFNNQVGLRHRLTQLGFMGEMRQLPGLLKQERDALTAYFSVSSSLISLHPQLFHRFLDLAQWITERYITREKELRNLSATLGAIPSTGPRTFAQITQVEGERDIAGLTPLLAHHVLQAFFRIRLPLIAEHKDQIYSILTDMIGFESRELRELVRQIFRRLAPILGVSNPHSLKTVHRQSI